jgi:sRNA-binding carbon storage regulator CsrA
MSLILSRKQSQSIITNGPSEFRIVRIDGNRVVVSIDARPEVLILRGEILHGKEPTDAESETLDR